MGRYHPFFSHRNGNDPPSSVEPLWITLEDQAIPYRAKPRRYAPAEQAFGRNGVHRAENMSFWACAAIPVAKLGTTDEFRLTIAYRLANAITIR
ncbi:hypothetical protein CCR75_002840 [Bremia lactucae]|uniref:Uncharacterized protein n=1 Tax=Bremia lactucae TaxID=4779 RepID=A0A976IDM1_BRELC|nr:hypothetical protein CCR75_002840 [Bremia lactucae]